MLTDFEQSQRKIQALTNQIQVAEQQQTDQNQIVSRLILEKNELVKIVKQLQGDKDEFAQIVKQLQGDKDKFAQVVKQLQDDKVEWSKSIKVLEKKNTTQSTEIKLLCEKLALQEKRSDNVKNNNWKMNILSMLVGSCMILAIKKLCN